MSLYESKKKIEVLSLFEKSISAMKLVALSTYNKIKKEIPQYRKEFLFNTIFFDDHFKEKIRSSSRDPKTMVILIGSQRGFCADLNTKMTARYFSLMRSYGEQNIIVVGKMLAIKIKEKGGLPRLQEEQTSFNKVAQFSDTINELLKKNKCDKVIIYYTASESISSKEIKQYTFIINHSFLSHKEPITEVVFKEKKESLFKEFCHYFFKRSLIYILKEALLCENSTRFITMDGALQSVEEALAEKKREYFKLRQQKINTDLGNLSGNLLQQ
jgi:F-type H+-transporting ATPase subunit gamma